MLCAANLGSNLRLLHCLRACKEHLLKASFKLSKSILQSFIQSDVAFTCLASDL